MTSKKQLKSRVRARMAKTGESYTTALLQVIGADPASGIGTNPAGVAAGLVPGQVSEHGYRLRGGLNPETANIANVLAHHGITSGDTGGGSGGGQPISEALVFGIGGGPGAGYILWEFKEHGAPKLTIGFRNQWQYPDRWTSKVLDRLGVPYEAHHTGGGKGAAARLSAELAAGRPCIIRPDRYHIGYWGLPPHLDGFGGHDVVAFAEDADGVHLDDRNLSPLTVPREALDRARGRVGSYKHSLYVIAPAGGEIAPDTLRAAVRAGLAECVTHLSAASNSFSLPAWRKWARLMTDTRGAKAWPKVFAERRGLASALLSVWEGTMPMGMTGGHLRGLYAEFLAEAAALLGNDDLREVATAFRAAAGEWERLAATALPDDFPELARLRELTSVIRESVADPAGTASEAGEIGEATRQLWALLAELDRDFPLDDGAVRELFAAMGETLTGVYERETAAVALLGKAIAGKS